MDRNNYFGKHKGLLDCAYWSMVPDNNTTRSATTINIYEIFMLASVISTTITRYWEHLQTK